MITRPLDLSSRLRPEPRSFDALFYVNAGLLVLFFFLFGSRFVLSPGLGVDFQLPQVQGANAAPQPTTYMVTVENAGQIFVGDGVRRIDELPSWLNEQAKNGNHPSLLVRASAGVPTEIVWKILGMARSAGFAVTLAADEPARAAGNAGGQGK
jgi:biopolymer transport protein ExbD